MASIHPSPGEGGVPFPVISNDQATSQTDEEQTEEEQQPTTFDAVLHLQPHLSSSKLTNASQIMDPNPNSHPILSYVMSRLPSIGPRFTPPTPADSSSFDIEQASAAVPSSPFLPIADPNLFASMANTVTAVYQTRSILQTLGPRPDHESLDLARSKLSEIDVNLAKKLEEIVLSPRPPHIDRQEWRAHLAEREREYREAAEREKKEWKAIIDLDELHGVYESMAREAEEKLVKLHERGGGKGDGNADRGKDEVEVEVSEDVVGVLEKGVMERVELSGRRLRVLPDAFGSIKGLLYLDVSNNQLAAIPDSIAGLDHLLELKVSSNLLESLPDSIGLLHNLKILNASSNKLGTLPDSICHCRSLVELDVSFNNLTYLSTNIGFELSNLQKLHIQYNKIRFLPSSVCEMYSLRHLDAHFNELHGLPLAIGKLVNLEYLNLSSNFSDLKELPDTFGDLTTLSVLDLSNNQIHTLPYTFGRLDNLTKLNLEQNPLVIPPVEVVRQGVEAVKEFMAKRWLDLLVEEEKKSVEEANEEKQTGWLTRSTSWLNNIVSDVSGSVSEYIGSPRSPRDPYLDQRL